MTKRARPMLFARVVRCTDCRWSETSAEHTQHDRLLNAACPQCGSRDLASRSVDSDRAWLARHPK